MKNQNSSNHGPRKGPGLTRRIANGIRDAAATVQGFFLAMQAITHPETFPIYNQPDASAYDAVEREQMRRRTIWNEGNN